VPNRSTNIVPAASSPNPGTTVFNDQKQNRVIAGISYWFPHQGAVSAAILIDYDAQTLKNITTAPVKAVTLHGLISF
jgi:hypothetical protein